MSDTNSVVSTTSTTSTSGTVEICYVTTELSDDQKQFFSYCSTDETKAIQMMNSNIFNETFFSCKDKKKGETALMKACKYSSFLTKYIIDFPLFTSNHLGEKAGNFDWTPTMLYICRHQPELVIYTIESGKFTKQRLNNDTIDGYTMLAHTFLHMPEIFKYIMESEYFSEDYFQKTFYDKSIISHLASKGDLDLLSYIINSDKFKPEYFDVRDYYGNTALMKLCGGSAGCSRMMCGCCFDNKNCPKLVDAVKIIVESDKFNSEQLNVKNKDGATPITLACDYQEHVAKYLIESNKFLPEYFDVDNHGCDPLLYACTNSQELAEYVINSNKFQPKTFPPRSIARICDKYPQIAKMLINSGKISDPNLFLKNNSMGFNALICACIRDTELMEQIINLGISIDSLNNTLKDGNTLLMYACSINPDSARFLLTNNFVTPQNAVLVNNKCETALTIAKKKCPELCKDIERLTNSAPKTSVYKSNMLYYSYYTYNSIYKYTTPICKFIVSFSIKYYNSIKSYIFDNTPQLLLINEKLN